MGEAAEIFKFKCDHCGQRIETSDDRVGQEVKCPGCRELIMVPEAPSAVSFDPPPQTIDLSTRRAERGAEVGSEEELLRQDAGDREIPANERAQYKVVPLTLTQDEASTPISVARRLERLINAFSGDGWRFSQVETVSYETKGKLGAKEEIAPMVIFERE